ncbi:MAG: hypothetical protein ACLUN9_25780 [Enterocloster aldenensis]
MQTAGMNFQTGSGMHWLIKAVFIV